MNKKFYYLNKFFSKNKNKLSSLFNYDLNKVNYIINISHKYKYIYFETPKVGCSSIKKTLLSLETTKISKDIHNKQESPLLSPLDLPFSFDSYLKNYFTFSFVRNPYTRILSCYLDKVINNQEERLIRLPKLGLNPSKDISFETFLLAVKDHLYDDIHWIPQSVLLSSSKISLDFIGKQESFTEDFQFVLNKINQNVTMICERPHSVSANNKLHEFLNEKTIKLIQEIYYDDFIVYNYNINPPLN